MEMIQTRNLMYVPAKYTPLFLNSRGESPCVAWDTLMPLLTQDNCLVDCQVLLNWLQVSLTLVAPTANAANQPPTIANLQPPLVGVARDEDLTKH